MKERSKNIILIVLIISLLFLFLFILFFKPYMKVLYNNREVDYIELELNNNLDNLKIESKYINKDISSKVIVDNNVDTKKVGDYEINYYLNYLIYNIHKVVRVRVIEKEKPIITLNGNTEAETCSSHTYTEEGYTAIDNYDGDITDKVNVERKDNRVIYSVKDSSGNESIVERTILSSDNSAPEIIINGEEKVYIEINGKYKEEGFEVSDNCDTEITNKETSGKVDTSKIGTYEINYKAIDSSGNIGKKTRYVYVYDPKNASNSTNSEKGVIYLTFDDGPSIYTTKILDTLKKYDIKATFFVTSNGKDKLIKREYEEGHTVAIHTYSHNYEKVYSSVDNYFKDLNKVSSRIENITNEKPTILRFPGGSSNTISKSIKKGIMTTLTKEVVNRGYHYFDWSLSVEDAGKCASKKSDKSKETCVYNNFVKGIKKSKMNVVLMHDIKSYTANKLDDMIKFALSQDYKFDKITMETTQVHHKVNN